jgi:hypothetical protein
MTAVPFGTLKLADKLQASGFTADQARGAATALAEAMSEGSARKDDIQDVRTSIELAKRDLKIWFVSTLVVAVGILLAAIRYLKVSGMRSVAPPARQPISRPAPTSCGRLRLSLPPMAGSRLRWRASLRRDAAAHQRSPARPRLAVLARCVGEHRRSAGTESKRCS